MVGRKQACAAGGAAIKNRLCGHIISHAQNLRLRMQRCGALERLVLEAPVPVPQTAAPPTGTIYLRHGNLPN